SSPEIELAQEIAHGLFDRRVRNGADGLRTGPIPHLSAPPLRTVLGTGQQCLDQRRMRAEQLTYVLDREMRAVGSLSAASDRRVICCGLVGGHCRCWLRRRGTRP